jgi:hypothetical protein
LRAKDVYRLGLVFQTMLAHVDGDFRTFKFARDFPGGSPDFQRTMSAAPKIVTRDDFHSLFRVMLENDETNRPTAETVADYLRLGNFDWLYWHLRGDIFCKTCGECCT